MRLLFSGCAIAQALVALIAGPTAAPGAAGVAAAARLPAAGSAEPRRLQVEIVFAVTPFLDALDPRVQNLPEVRTQLNEMKQLVSSHGVPVIDSNPAFASLLKRHDIGEVFLDAVDFDGHLTPMGHSYYSGWLARELTRLGHIDGTRPDENATRPKESGGKH